MSAAVAWQMDEGCSSKSIHYNINSWEVKVEEA